MNPQLNLFEQTLRNLGRRHERLREAAFDLLVDAEGLDFVRQLEVPPLAGLAATTAPAPSDEAAARRAAYAYVASFGLELLHAVEATAERAARWMRELLASTRPRPAMAFFGGDQPQVRLEIPGRTGQDHADFVDATWLADGTLRIAFDVPADVASVPGMQQALCLVEFGRDDDRRGSDLAFAPTLARPTEHGLSLCYEVPFVTNQLSPELRAPDQRVWPDAIARVFLFPNTGRIGG